MNHSNSVIDYIQGSGLIQQGKGENESQNDTACYDGFLFLAFAFAGLTSSSQ